ncbi:MAG: gamma carbonic anhydrase family protein [Thermoleophilaceae bacterium]
MLIERDGTVPSVDRSARIAPTAVLVGDVHVGADTYVGHGTLIESTGPAVTIGRASVIMQNAVIRSVGGGSAGLPVFPTWIGDSALIGPLVALAGCSIGDDAYIATQAIVFYGARVGRGARVGAGAIVHTGTELEPGSSVGLRQVAAPGENGPIITSDLEQARQLVPPADYFGMVFATGSDDQEALHRDAIEKLRAEMLSFNDFPLEGRQR